MLLRPSCARALRAAALLCALALVPHSVQAVDTAYSAVVDTIEVVNTRAGDADDVTIFLEVMVDGEQAPGSPATLAMGALTAGVYDVGLRLPFLVPSSSGPGVPCRGCGDTITISFAVVNAGEQPEDDLAQVAMSAAANASGEAICTGAWAAAKKAAEEASISGRKRNNYGDLLGWCDGVVAADAVHFLKSQLDAQLAVNGTGVPRSFSSDCGYEGYAFPDGCSGARSMYNVAMTYSSP